MASLARASHFSSRRSCSSVSVAKNFVLLRAGWPSGFSKPAATSMESNLAVQIREPRRLGCVESCGNNLPAEKLCLLLRSHSYADGRSALGPGRMGFGLFLRNSSALIRVRRIRIQPGLALGSW